MENTKKNQGFKKDGTSMSKEKVAHKMRRVEIELGDVKQPNRFYPQFKTKHWDNEANLSIRLHDESYAGAEVSDFRGGIQWKKGNRTARFYDKDTGDEDGGFEIEVELEKKPENNRLVFTIQHKGLDFLYQPALSDEVIAKEGEYVSETEHYRFENGEKVLIASRPENVVGSYAVYHSSRRDNAIGGKEYRTGKAFHIYRPYALDSRGEKVWCSLEINKEAGKLSVVVPQDFLDRAVYPVLIDPTLGYTSTGASDRSTGGADDGIIYGFHYASYAISISKITAALKGASGNRDYNAGVYHDYVNGASDSGKSLYYHTSTVTGTGSYAWYDDTGVSGTVVTQPTFFFGAMGSYSLNPQGGATLAYDSSSGTACGFANGSITQFSDDTTSLYSVYITYTDLAGLSTDYFSVAFTNPSTNVTVTPSTLNATFALGSASEKVDVSISPARQDAVFAILAPTVTAIRNITVSASTLNATFALGSATPQTSVSLASARLNATFVLNAPTVTATQNASISPARLNAAFAILTPTVTAIQNASISPSRLNATFALNAPNVITPDAYSAPARLNASFAILAPTVTAIRNVTVSPTLLTATFALRAPLTVGDVSIAPSRLNATFAVNAPTVTAVRNITVTPARLNAAFSILSPSVQGYVSSSPSRLNATFALNAPTVTAIRNVTISPAQLSASFAILTPTVTATRFVTISGSTLNATFAVNAPTVTATRFVTVTPARLNATFAIAAPTESGGALVSPSRLNATFAILAPTVTATRFVTVSPSTLNATFAVVAPSVKLGITTSVSKLNATFAVRAPSIITSVTVSPSRVNAAFSLPSATVLLIQQVSPSRLNATFAVRAPSIIVSVVVSPTVIGAAFSIAGEKVIADFWQPKYPVNIGVGNWSDKDTPPDPIGFWSDKDTGGDPNMWDNKY